MDFMQNISEAEAAVCDSSYLIKDVLGDFNRTLHSDEGMH
jgi:hypothetical protein